MHIDFSGLCKMYKNIKSKRMFKSLFIIILRHSSATFGVWIRKRMPQQHNEQRILTNFYDSVFIYCSSTGKIDMIFM